jgi:hypothetical protein
MAELRDALFGILASAEQQPMTVRQVFYRMVSLGAVDKTEAEYKQTVIRLLTEMRLDGTIPFHWISDSTRWMRKPRTYSDGVAGALALGAETYRRALWDDQDAYVEVWCEKEALVGVLLEVTGPWDVPLMVVRGDPSLTFLHGAAETIEDQGKPAFLYYFGDSDTKGHQIQANIQRRLEQFAPGAAISFTRAAVTDAQIEAYGLLTRPDKTSGKPVVEVDAIRPIDLVGLVENCITQHIDRDVLARTQRIEREEQQSFQALAKRWTRKRA